MKIQNRKTSIIEPIESELKLNKLSSKGGLTTTKVFDFIHQRVESKGIDPMIVIELMKKSDWNNSSLWNQNAPSPYSKTLQKLEKKYGLDVIRVFQWLIEYPFITLQDVGDFFGFTRENTRLIFKKIYGFPYSLLYARKLGFQKKVRESLSIKRLSHSRRFLYEHLIIMEARRHGLVCNYHLKDYPFELRINGKTIGPRIAVRKVKLKYDSDLKYYRCAGKKIPYDFFICVCHHEKEFIYYIIPGDVLPKGGAYLPDPTKYKDSSKLVNKKRSKYLPFLEAWDLLK
jgi:hypothetical protein